MPDKKKKKRENGTNKANTPKAQLKAEKKKVKKKALKERSSEITEVSVYLLQGGMDSEGCYGNCTDDLSIRIIYFELIAQLLFSHDSWTLHDAGGGVCQWWQWGTKHLAGRPGKSQQQQGESEQAVPVAHQPHSCQVLLQVWMSVLAVFFFVKVYSAKSAPKSWKKFIIVCRSTVKTGRKQWIRVFKKSLRMCHIYLWVSKQLLFLFLFLKGDMGKETYSCSAQESGLLQRIVLYCRVWSHIKTGTP